MNNAELLVTRREEALARLDALIQKHNLPQKIKSDFERGQIDVSYKNADGIFSSIPLDAAHESYKAAVSNYGYPVFHVVAQDPFSPYFEEDETTVFLCFWSQDWPSDREEQDWILDQVLNKPPHADERF